MVEKNIYTTSMKTKDMVKIGLTAAIIFVATAAFHIPSAFMGVLHLGDSMIFLAAVLLGSKRAAVASAIGMSLFDVIHGYLLWAPFTFVIKGVMAYIAGTIAYRGLYEGKKMWNNTFAFVVAGIWMVVAYYVGGVIILCFLSDSKMPLSLSMLEATKDIVGNIGQVLAGMVIAIPLSKILKGKIE